MLYHLFYEYLGANNPLRIFKYITFRASLAMAISFLITFFLMPKLIQWLKTYNIGQPVREDDVPEQAEKSGTPTMGGLAVIAGLTISMLLLARFDQPFVWLALGITLVFAAVGFVDDFRKVAYNDPKGLSGKLRLLIETIASLLFVFCAVKCAGLKTDIIIPFVWKTPFVDVAFPIFALFSVLVIVGSANAVNLTDGMDGLATGPSIIAAGVFTLLAYLAGHAKLSAYLGIAYIPGAGELTLFAAALAGALLAFLWYNCNPASVFMGDLGSLSIGAALGAMAVLTHNELLMIIIGGVFVFETISVIIQVTSYKLTGKRVFLVAPYHHSLERRGWKEQQIVVRMWIIAIILGLIALSSLKLRFNLWR